MKPLLKSRGGREHGREVQNRTAQRWQKLDRSNSYLGKARGIKTLAVTHTPACVCVTRFVLNKNVTISLLKSPGGGKEKNDPVAKKKRFW